MGYRKFIIYVVTTLQWYRVDLLPHCFTVHLLLKPKLNSEGAGQILMCVSLCSNLIDCTAIKNMTLFVNFRHSFLE